MGRWRLLFTSLSQIHKTLNPTLKPPNPARRFAAAAAEQATSSSSPPPSPPPPPASDKVASIVEDMSELTLLEMSDLTEVLRNKLGVKEMPIMAVMMPGMGFSSGLRGAGGKGGAAAAAGTGKEEKAEKTVFDLKLDGFEAASKIKVIKEVRGFTDLGLKEAKDLVEKAPTLLKKGVSKEEAEKIIAKMKEVGAKVSME